MQYLIVENRQIVHLGPMNWNTRKFQSEINDLADQEGLEIDFTFSPTEPEGYIKISDTLEVFPVDAINVPDHNPLFEQLVGPFWNYDGNKATASYDAIPADINASKGALKQLAANQRWIKENTPFKMTVQGVEITVDVSRDNRNIFVQKYSMMADNETVDWKFPETWLTLTKAELGEVVSGGAAHIQTQFDWEKSLVDQIDSATSFDVLKTLVDQIVPPVNNFPGVV